MITRARATLCTATAALIVVAGHLLHAQNPPTFIPDIRFATGRSVVPYLEGWIKNPDETFDFVFGYFNRNTQEELVIPVGPNNSITPDGPDRGQPTYFMARRQPRILRVKVPKDWGDKALTWSITANGVTEKVVSKLLPAEEVNERMMIANGNNIMQLGEEDPNQPPTVTVSPPAGVTAGAPVTLTAIVKDDGLPKPRAPAPARPTQPASRFQSQRNSTTSNPNAIVGLRLTWLEYRGPAKVTFETNPIKVANEKAVTTARFAAPGTYTLIAVANDGKLSTRSELTVTVK
ncbi:MAG TPA: hypothetical protein VNZ26_09285 [Vicinamibacterales bacterium]|jgi:hypothetical protein|nr:hypothetical protein [Vicinamibacterales bacterium]